MMSRKRVVFTLILVLLMILGMNSFGYTSDNIGYYPNWEKGESQRYDFSKQVYQNNSLISENAGSFTITVEEVLEDGYILKWANDETKTNDLKASGLSDDIINSIVDIDLLYKVNKYGTFVDFMNLSEIKQRLNEMLDYIVQTLESEDEKEQFRQIVATILNDNNISIILSKEITMIHNAYICGYVFDVSQTYEDEVILPNPFEGDPFNGRIEIFATHMDNMDRIEVNQQLDREKSAQILNNFVEKIVSQTVSLKGYETIILNSIDIQDQFVSLFKPGSNWLDQVAMTRTIKIMNVSRIEKYSFNTIH